MIDILELEKLLISKNILWEEKETKPELFQYNFYMRFFYIQDIDIEKFKNGEEYKKTICEDKTILNLVNDFVLQLEKKYNKKSGCVYFVKLSPQQYPLRQYYDSLKYSTVLTKCYIPIITNKDSNVCTEEDIFYAEPGKEFFINDEDLLAIYNFGDTETIYLVIDFLS